MQSKEMTLEDVRLLETDIAELLKKYGLYEDYSYTVFMRHEGGKHTFGGINIEVYNEID